MRGLHFPPHRLPSCRPVQVGPRVLGVEPADELAAVVEGVDLAVGIADREDVGAQPDLGPAVGVVLGPLVHGLARTGDDRTHAELMVGHEVPPARGRAGCAGQVLGALANKVAYSNAKEDHVFILKSAILHSKNLARIRNIL